MSLLIKITDGTTTTTLANGPGAALGEPVGPDNLQLSGNVAAQVRPAMRGAATKVSKRGNLRSSVSWTSRYEFATHLAAQQFALVHHAGVLRENELQFVLDASNTVSIADAVIVDVEIQVRGVGVVVTYSVSGGAATLETLP